MLLSRPFPADHNARPREPTRRSWSRWKRGCGGETFWRFRPNWPSIT